MNFNLNTEDDGVTKLDLANFDSGIEMESKIVKAGLSPSKMLIKFMQEGIEDEPFLIPLKGDRKVGENFLHRMRVELSRMRGKLRSEGHVIKQFKIYQISIEEAKDAPEMIELIIYRTVSKANKISEDLNAVMSELIIPKDKA